MGIPVLRPETINTDLNKNILIVYILAAIPVNGIWKYKPLTAVFSTTCRNSGKILIRSKPVEVIVPRFKVPCHGKGKSANRERRSKPHYPKRQSSAPGN